MVLFVLISIVGVYLFVLICIKVSFVVELID